MADKDSIIEELEYEMAIEFYCYCESKRYLELQEQLAKILESKK